MYPIIKSTNIHFQWPQLNQGRSTIQSVFCIHLIVDLATQQEFCCIILIVRSWRTWKKKMNQKWLWPQSYTSAVVLTRVLLPFGSRLLFVGTEVGSVRAYRYPLSGKENVPQILPKLTCPHLRPSILKDMECVYAGQFIRAPISVLKKYFIV